MEHEIVKRFRKVIDRVWQALPLNRRDGLFIVGVAALVNGAADIYPPAGWIVMGLLLIGVWAQPYLMKRNNP